MKKLNLILLSAFSLFTAWSYAQTFTGIDIWPGSGSSNPYGMTTLNGKVYFGATGDTTTHGSEIWMSDGTQSGTVLLKDINPGKNGSYPASFTKVGNQLFFVANDGTHGFELWVTDGTTAGTVMVSDIVPGSSGSSPDYLTAFNGKLYFVANDSVHGNELWVSDGTPAGTSIIKDINPGISSSNPQGYNLGNGFYIASFNEFNGKLYFRANDGANGVELWTTDGTTAGTAMVADIWPGTGSSSPFFMTPYNGKLIFSAQDDSINGFNVWITDGTAAGTSMVKNINPVGNYGADAADYSGYVPLNGKLYFTAKGAGTGYELWGTDGTTAGTAIVKDIFPGPIGSYPGYNYDMISYDGKLYFSAMGDTLVGYQLWTSDGTAAGTTQLKQLSAYTPYNSIPFNVNVYNNRIIFTAGTDSVNLYQLWSSDGTASGTHIIAPAIAPYTNPLGNYSKMAEANGQLFLNAYFTSIGDELWIYATPTAIIETEGDHSISAYPNPFTAGITLSGLMSNENYHVQIADLSGRQCYSTEIEHSTQSMTLDMPELNTGVYVMTVKGAGSSHTFKIVKK